jgi:hypothetical protein
MTLDQRLLIALTRQEPERCFLERRLCERSKLSCRFAASPNDYLVEQQFHNPK